MGAAGASGSSASPSIQWWIWSMWMKPSPCTRGMRGFTWAMTTAAVSTAARATSTEVPSVQ